MEVYRRFTQALAKHILSFSVICFAVMTLCGGAQVVSRYVFNMSLEWTEEVARFMFIITTLFGSALCVKKLSHINVDLFLVKLSPKNQKLLEIFVTLASMVLFAIMFWYGIEIVMATMEQLAPATEVPMGVVYASVPLSGLFMLLFSLETLIVQIKKAPQAKQLEGAE